MYLSGPERIRHPDRTGLQRSPAVVSREHRVGSRSSGRKLVPMIDDFAKEYLHSDLREVRETMLWKLEGSPRMPLAVL